MEEHVDKSAEKDPCPDEMEFEKIVAVDTGQDAVLPRDIKYVQDDGVQEAGLAGFIAQVEETKRCVC